MHDAQLPEVADRTDQLLVEPARLLLLEFGLARDVREEFPVAAVLHNDVEASRGFNNLIHLNDVRVAHNLQDVDLSRNALNVVHFCDFILFEDFDRDLLIREQVNAFFDFAESSLAQGLGHSVATYDLLVGKNVVCGWRQIGQVLRAGLW